MTKRHAALLVTCLAATAACRGGGGEPDQSADTLAARPAAAPVELTLIAPDSMGWNQADSLRVTILNRTAAPLPAGVLTLEVARPALPDTVGAPAGVSAAATVLRLPLPAVAAGASHRVARALRLPPAPVDGAVLPEAYPVRAAYAGLARGDTVHVRRGSAVVVGGCATVRDPTAQRHGVGPVRVRMSAAALRAACPEARDSSWQAEGTTERGLVLRPGGAPLLAVLLRDTVTRIDVADPRVRTAAGLGAGSTLGELRARYGRVCGGAGEGVVAVWSPNAPGISFALDSAATRAWFGTPGRPITDIPDSARVARLFIHGEDARCPNAGDR